MTRYQSLVRLLDHALHSAYARVRSTCRERGDVPGWVLITVMTAALVTALALVAKPLLTSIFDKAVNSVTG
jgi:hypothetical protein